MLLPQELTKAVRSVLLDGRDDVLIALGRLRLRPSEHALCDAIEDARLEDERGDRVSGVV